MPKPAKLSHYDAAGQARMVDVSAKQTTKRSATASAFVELSAAVLAALPANPKGNPLEVARIAGIQAAKRTSELIPMLEAAFKQGGVHLVAVPIDYSENMRVLVEELGNRSVQ